MVSRVPKITTECVERENVTPQPELWRLLDRKLECYKIEKGQNVEWLSQDALSALEAAEVPIELHGACGFYKRVKCACVIVYNRHNGRIQTAFKMGATKR